MITKEQIKKYCEDWPFSDLLYARLDRKYQAEWLDYILPAGTIVQVKLYVDDKANLYIDGRCVTIQFPYDAAILLETEE